MDKSPLRSSENFTRDYLVRPHYCQTRPPKSLLYKCGCRVTSHILSYVDSRLDKIYVNTLELFPQSVSLMQGKLLESPKSCQLAMVTLNFEHLDSSYMNMR